jgi:hypothetical protein
MLLQPSNRSFTCRIRNGGDLSHANSIVDHDFTCNKLHYSIVWLYTKVSIVPMKSEGLDIIKVSRITDYNNCCSTIRVSRITDY